MLICYILNPIVLLFCDKDGELHGFLHYFQTWDDSCNPRCAVMEMAPKIISYDWDKHYIEYQTQTPELAPYNRTRWVAKCINDDFTIGERIKRYLCRVYWLTRNCSYGFSFYWFGCEYDPEDLVIDKNYPDGRNRTAHTKGADKWSTYWCYKNSDNIFGSVYWNVYLGWKLDLNPKGHTRAMIANRIAFKLHEEY
jgi:hypothetical protein